MNGLLARTLLVAVMPLVSIMASTYITGGMKWGYDLPFYHIPTFTVLIPFYFGLELGLIALITPSLLHGGIYFLLNIPFGKTGYTSVKKALTVLLSILSILVVAQIWYWSVSYSYGLEYQSANYMTIWGIVGVVSTLLLCIRAGSLLACYRRSNADVPNEALLNLTLLIHSAVILLLFPYLGELL
jgi:hypothetical protein